MNPLQLAQQLKHELALVTWPEAGGAVVFGERQVFVTSGYPDERHIPQGTPWAMVTLDTSDFDDEDPGSLEQSLTVLYAASVKGGTVGEFAVTGGPQTVLGKSANRGIGELAHRVRAAVGNLKAINGSKIIVSADASGAPQNVGRAKDLVLGELNLLALCTSVPHYSEPQEFAFNGGTWSWAGGSAAVRGHCSGRFDFVQYRIGYVTGTTPVQSPDDCEAIVYTGPDPTSVAPQLSGKAYSVFADYNARQSAGVIEGSSDGRRVGAYLVT